MSKTMLVVFSVAAVAIVASVAICAVPGEAQSQSQSQSESLSGSDSLFTASNADPAPQRLELAQAQAQAHEQATGGTATSTLPGGASSLNETYADWRVACMQQGKTKRCALSQAQAQQNGQRVLAIELAVPSDDTVTGLLVLPFGLALDSGVSFQIDDTPAMPPIRFRTCVPAGCLVDTSFDAPALEALRAGAVLKIKATADGGDRKSVV